jgi:hypothetical protein
VISANAAHGTHSHIDYDTSSYLKTVQNILGVSELPCADAADRNTAASMTDLFTPPPGLHRRVNPADGG